MSSAIKSSGILCIANIGFNIFITLFIVLDFNRSMSIHLAKYLLQLGNFSLSSVKYLWLSSYTIAEEESEELMFLGFLICIFLHASHFAPVFSISLFIPGQFILNKNHYWFLFSFRLFLNDLHVICLTPLLLNYLIWLFWLHSILNYFVIINALFYSICLPVPAVCL